MASFDEFDDTLTCPVCLETFDRPKFLKCHHTVCETRCAQTLLQKSGAKDSITCPQCCEITVVTNGDVSTLQTNFYITDALQQRRKPGAGPCALHPGHTLWLWCGDCREAACSKCLEKEHLRHAVLDLKEGRRQLEDCQPRLQAAADQLHSHVQKQWKMKQDSEDMKHNIERRLRERAAVIHKAVDEELDNALASLDKVSRNLLSLLSGRLRSPLLRLSRVQSLQQKVRHALGEGAAPAVFGVVEVMSTGEGSSQELRQMTSNLSAGDERIMFSPDNAALSRRAVRQYLGLVQLDTGQQEAQAIQQPKTILRQTSPGGNEAQGCPGNQSPIPACTPAGDTTLPPAVTSTQSHTPAVDTTQPPAVTSTQPHTPAGDTTQPAQAAVRERWSWLPTLGFSPESHLHRCKFMEQFRCQPPQKSVSRVHSIYRDQLGYVSVAYSTGEAEGVGYVGQYTDTGSLVLTSEAVRGRVCLTSFDGVDVHVEGQDFGGKCLSILGTFVACQHHAVRDYDLYNKGQAKWALRVHASGSCDLKRVTSTTPGESDDDKVCDVPVCKPVAMDVSKNGSTVAVIEQRSCFVRFFYFSPPGRLWSESRYNGSRNCKNPNSCVYRKAFKPQDVCFFHVGGTELLVVADSLNYMLRVLDVCNGGCRLVYCVGDKDHLQLQPTALLADGTDRLWVGCEGGSLVTMVWTDHHSIRP